MENIIFNDLDLSIETKKAIKDMGFEEATQIQSQSIPEILKGHDIIGQAQTGTGKTCAFGIPISEMMDNKIEGVQALVLCPTRELAIQSSAELKELLKYKKNIVCLPIYGGQPIDRQIKALRKRPQIIIGTPGRVMDHLRRNTLKLKNLKMLILDEADEMLNMGFREDIDVIIEKIPNKRQTILFSATMPREILELTKKYQDNPVKIKVFHKEVTVSNIEQFYLEVSNNSKLELLSRIIDTNNLKQSLIFCNTKKRVEEVATNLQARGYSADFIHGDIKQEQRDRVMDNFRKGNFDILTATDVAARGIDVENIEAVFNYDVPNDEEYYVHRIGRTGRAGKSGKAFTFVVGRDIFKLRDIQKYTNSPIQKIKPPTIFDIEEMKITKLSEQLKEIIKENNLKNYIKSIEAILEDVNSPKENDSLTTVTEVSAAFLKLYSEQNTTKYESIKEDNPDSLEENEMARLFINIGRNNNVKPKNIIESIVSVTNLPSNVVGSIDIYNEYTFVEVPRIYAQDIIKSLKNYKINKKRINIEKSHSKKKVKSHPRTYKKNIKK
ncbi:MAG: DEAD/DEAH box helicase [Clostridiales bacterium]